MAITTTKAITPNFGIINRKPDRVVLIANPGEENAESFTVLLNPTTLKETITVEWSKLPVIGLDHEVPHYSRTRSIQIPMSFYFSAYEQARRSFTPNLANNGSDNMGSVLPASAIARQSIDFVNFLRSLCFPTREGLRPPTVKVTWPNVLEFLAVVESVTFTYTKFDRSLAPIAYQADVNFLEVRLTRRFSEDVREDGLVSDSFTPTIAR